MQSMHSFPPPLCKQKPVRRGPKFPPSHPAWGAAAVGRVRGQHEVALVCGAERLSTGVFLVLPPTCVLRAKSQSSCENFSAFTVSQPIRVCLRQPWEPSRLPGAAVMGCASVASSDIHFTSRAIMHKSQWKCSLSVLLWFLSDASPRVRKSCVAACQTGCVCARVCGSRTERAGGRGFERRR